MMLSGALNIGRDWWAVGEPVGVGEEEVGGDRGRLF
jgi:hypothetical protein